MPIGPLAHGWHGQHDNGIRNTERTGPSQSGPLGLVGHSPYKISSKNGRDDDRGVARVGKVVHGPAKYFFAFNAWIEHGHDAKALN